MVERVSPYRYSVTIDSGVELGRPVLAVYDVAKRILEDQAGRRHVRRSDYERLVATVDMQRRTFVVFLHGARLDPHDWPSWTIRLSTLLGFNMQETTQHDQDPGTDG